MVCSLPIISHNLHARPILSSGPVSGLVNIPFLKTMFRGPPVNKLVIWTQRIENRGCIALSTLIWVNFVSGIESEGVFPTLLFPMILNCCEGGPSASSVNRHRPVGFVGARLLPLASWLGLWVLAAILFFTSLAATLGSEDERAACFESGSSFFKYV